MTCQPALDCVRHELRQRQLDEIMEEPKYQQRKWKIQDEGTEQRVSEPVVGRQAKKIFEVRCEGADQQARKHKAEASKRESGSTVCECKRHLHIMNQTCLWTFRACLESSVVGENCHYIRN